MKSRKCSYCEKVIEGYNDHHVEYLLQQHTLTKHKENVQIKLEDGDTNNGKSKE